MGTFDFCSSFFIHTMPLPTLIWPTAALATFISLGYYKNQIDPKENIMKSYKILTHPKDKTLFQFEHDFSENVQQETAWLILWWMTLACSILTVSLTLALKYLNLPNFKKNALTTGFYLVPVLSTLSAGVTSFCMYRIMDYLVQRSTMKSFQEFFLDDAVTHVEGCSIWIFASLILLQLKSVLKVLQGDYHRLTSTAYSLAFSLICTHFYTNPPSGTQVYVPIGVFCLSASFGGMAIQGMCPRSMQTRPVVLQVYLLLCLLYNTVKWFVYGASVVGLAFLTRELNRAGGENGFVEKSDIMVGVASLVFASKPVVEELVRWATAKQIKKEFVHLKPKAA